MTEPTTTTHHVVTVVPNTDQRPGLTYATWSCSCGTRSRTSYRGIAVAQAFADAHLDAADIAANR